MTMVRVCCPGRASRFWIRNRPSNRGSKTGQPSWFAARTSCWAVSRPGLIVGKATLVEQMRRNPLYRTLRLDKLRLALLHHALLQYLAGRKSLLPVWKALTDNLDGCRERLKLREGIDWVTLRAQTGGGSNPEESFESLGLRFSGRSGQTLKERFAARPIPILGYIQGNAFHVDVRTLFPEDFAELQQAIDEL